MEVNIIGAGLAGSEAALQLAKRGFKVNLFEMRPEVKTGAHTTEDCAEFVCSNSLGSDDITNGSGLLKCEMEMLGGELIEIAKACRVPAGNALAIDRHKFSQTVTAKILENENINLIRKEVVEIPEGPVIIASGPLTSSEFAKSIKNFTQSEYLHFFDAIAPIVVVDSIYFDVAFWASRYDKGEASYINCPMNKEQYEKFYKQFPVDVVYSLYGLNICKLLPRVIVYLEKAISVIMSTDIIPSNFWYVVFRMLQSIVFSPEKEKIKSRNEYYSSMMKIFERLSKVTFLEVSKLQEVFLENINQSSMNEINVGKTDENI